MILCKDDNDDKKYWVDWGSNLVCLAPLRPRADALKNLAKSSPNSFSFDFEIP